MFAIRWEAIPPARLSWTRWDDGYVAYHRDSGQTHFLNAASQYLITDFLLEPRSAGEIASVFASDTEPASGEHDRLQREIERLLIHLEQIGLVRGL